MSKMIHLDYETASAADITLGSYRYASDPTTRILMFAVAEDEGNPLVWDFVSGNKGESGRALQLLRKHIATRTPIYSHNAQFECAMSMYRMLPDLGIHHPPFNQWRCTLAMCRRAAAPESLSQAAEFFGLGVPKDPRGKALIGVFSDLRKPTKLTHPSSGETVDVASPILEDNIRWDWLVQLKGAGTTMTVREAWELFKEYCRQDVRVEQALHKKIEHFELTEDVLESFNFDLRMNARGVPVNVKALTNAQKIVDELKVKLGRDFKELTGHSHTQRGVTLAWLKERGYPAQDLQSKTVSKVLREPEGMTPEAVKALSLRSMISFAALAKIPAMLKAVCDDGYVRGSTQWHAARTGRAGGRIIQPQNFRKSTVGSDTDVCYKMICDGVPSSVFLDLWDSPLEAIASSIRHFIQPKGGKFFDCDYSGVENRVTAWIVGDETELRKIVSGVDMYKDMASKMFKVPYDQVSKEQRTIAKPVVLGCIAEGQKVLTRDRGEVEIENILIDDSVWDGVEWVRHEGLIYKGIKEVITYQGLTATVDHKVWVEERTGKVDLVEARNQSYRLVDTGKNGSPILRLDIDKPNSLPPQAIPEGKSGLRLWSACLELLRRIASRNVSEMQSLHGEEPTSGTPVLVGRSDAGSAGPMSEPFLQSLQRLRCKGHSVQVSVTTSCSSMDHGQPRTASGFRDRPDRQQWPLRTWKSSLCNQVATVIQHSTHQAERGFSVSAGRMANDARQYSAEAAKRLDTRTNPRRRAPDCSAEAEKLQDNPKKVRVYDLLNAGPRHRFTCSGKLVSNCGFGVGGKAARKTLDTIYNVKRSLAECKEYVRIYRDTHPETVAAWKSLEIAAKSAVQSPGKSFVALDGKVSFKAGRVAGINYLTMRLPSGRRIYYPDPKIKDVFRKYDEEDMEEEPHKRIEGGYWVEELSFYGRVTGKAAWGRIGTYGSRLLENAVQATAADLLNYGCLEAEREGFDIRMIIHDQILALHNDRPVEQLVEAFCRKQPWASDFPLDATGDVVPYYTKDA